MQRSSIAHASSPAPHSSRKLAVTSAPSSSAAAARIEQARTPGRRLATATPRPSGAGADRWTAAAATATVSMNERIHRPRTRDLKDNTLHTHTCAPSACLVPSA
eukprot:6228439-Prymnesium_polylepis.1